MVLLLRNQRQIWDKIPCCYFLVDGYCYFLKGSGWSLDGLLCGGRGLRSPKPDKSAIKLR